jgi:hypothetical protein
MDDATKKIIRDLAKHRPRNLIITEVSERFRLKWDDAERLVERVEEDHSRTIQSRQKPYFILLGSLMTVGGLALSIYMLYAAANGLFFLLLRLPIPYLGNLVFFGIGILIMIGGLRGVIRIVGAKDERE